MKRKHFLLGLLPLLLPLSSCGEPSPTVHAFAYDLSDTYIASFFEELKADLTPEYAYSLYNAERSQAKQNKQINESFENTKDGAQIVNTVDRLASGAIIKKRKAHSPEGGPLIFVNREPLQSDLNNDDPFVRDHCFYVGANSMHDGILQANIASSAIGSPSVFPSTSFDKNKDGKVQVAILKGELGHQDAELRTKHCVQSLKNAGYQVEIVDSIYANWGRDTGFEAAKELDLQRIEVLFSNNDDMALGAIDYLKTLPEKEEVTQKTFAERFFPIIGVDGTAPGKKAVEDGLMTGTVLNDARMQARIVQDIINAHFYQTPLPKTHDSIERNGNFYYIKGIAITKDNIGSF